LRKIAWVALDPGQMHGCRLSDISQAGERISVEKDMTLPDQFMLFLSNYGAARRTCRVVWRNERKIGVKFERRLATAKPATRESNPASDSTPRKSTLAESA